MIISGFGMCNGYYQKLKTGTYSIDAFYSKRYKRTVPFFALLILLNCVTEFTPKTVCEGLMEITMLFGFLPNNTLSTIGVAWTLGAIFAFYIIFPFIVFLLYKKQFYIPEGFAHGFYVISDIAEVCFKVSDYWHPNDEIGIPWNDPELKINWPIKENEMPIIADKDLHYDSFSLLKEKLVQREE